MRIPHDSTSTKGYYGRANGLSSVPSVTLAPYVYPNNFYGTAVATAGDVNGDGYADVVFSDPGYDSGKGRVSIYLGSCNGLSTTPALELVGENTGDQFGFAVNTTGDVNGDGAADFVVGTDPTTAAPGRAYVYLGNPQVFPANPTGENAHDYLGLAVAAGDVNGDGYTDAIIETTGEYPSP